MARHPCKILILLLLILLGLGQISLNIATILVQISPVENKFSDATNCTLTCDGSRMVEPIGISVAPAGVSNPVQYLAGASALSGVFNLVSSLVLMCGCCSGSKMSRFFTSIVYVIVSNAFSEIADLIVTILVASTTFSPSGSGMGLHFWLAVSADICSMLIGIIQPLVMLQKERKSKEYY